MWSRLLLSCLQRKSNRPVWLIISSVNSATVSAGDMAIYRLSPLTLLSRAPDRSASYLKNRCLVGSFQNKLMLCSLSIKIKESSIF